MKERRTQARVDAIHPVYYRRVDVDENAEPIGCSTVNASNQGLAIRVYEELRVGEKLTLEIHANPSKPPIQAVAEVAWCEPVDGELTAGLVFLWIGCPSLMSVVGLIPDTMWTFR